MLKLETDLHRYDEGAVERLIAVLPPSWQARVTRKKRFAARRQSAIAYTLLSQILREGYGISALPAIATNEYGKPFFENSPLFFSISHCMKAVVVLVEERPVGVDVQELLEDISPALAARIAAPRDPAAMTPTELTALWTQKEASAKLDGKGLSVGLESLPLHEHIIHTEDLDFGILSIATNRKRTP